MTVKIGSVVQLVHNDQAEYKDEQFTVNNGGVVETRSRRVRVDNGVIDIEVPLVVTAIRKLSDGSLVVDGQAQFRTVTFVENIPEGNPSTPNTFHEID